LTTFSRNTTGDADIYETTLRTTLPPGPNAVTRPKGCHPVQFAGLAISTILGQ